MVYEAGVVVVVCVCVCVWCVWCVCVCICLCVCVSVDAWIGGAGGAVGVRCVRVVGVGRL